MIKTEIMLPFGYTAEDIRTAITEKLPIGASELGETVILKRTLDLSDKKNIKYKMSVGISLSEEREAGLLKMKKKVSAVPSLSFSVPRSALSSRPLVVGCGPCGLFAALVLAEAGARPIIIERGLSVDERIKKVELFNKLGILDPECNIQFGEGGAGTYSDGKLKVGGLDKYKMKVLSELAANGADESILYSSTAHVGTDKLSDIIKKIREKIISLGGEFIFSARLTEISVSNGSVASASYIKNGREEQIDTENIILATGHSARDVFSMLEKMRVPMQAKGFGIGVRIEHPREYIDRLVYGDAPPTGLSGASYHLVTHLKNGRSVYSFCMCPGGSVVAATSEDCAVVTNGMSEHARSAENSNAAFLVSVTPEDFGSDSPLSGIEYQRSIERAVYSLTNSYKAPVSDLQSFLSSEPPRASASVRPTYPVGTELISPEAYLPEFITESLRASISDFDSWMPGFLLPDAVMTGAETRSTSPVRIERGALLESSVISGLYPSGEGAGYSGGIISSAVDGIRCAEAMLAKMTK